MEPRMKEPVNWKGALGMVMGGTLYVDMSGDEDDMEGNIDKLIKEVRHRQGYSYQGYGEAASPSRV